MVNRVKIVANRPFVLASAAISLDGYLDDTTGDRLILSNPADLDRVDTIRAGVDAILVGANTIRRDDPALLVRSPSRRADREARGLPPSPVRVTLTGSGDLDAAYRFFNAGADSLVYTDGAAGHLADAATVVTVGAPLDPAAVLADLAGRGVRRLLVEGGSAVLSRFLAADLVDELRLAVAPLLVGDPAATRFVGPGRYPYHAGRRMALASVERIGDVAVLVYHRR